MIGARFWKFDIGICVVDRFAHSMSHEIGRSHHVHELLVDHPTAFVLEALGFYK